MKNNTFILTPQRIKHLGINLTKYVPDQYEEDYKILTKEIKDDTNRWRDISCAWIGRINNINIKYYPKKSPDSMESL